MDIKKQFEYNPSIDVTAAQIGINKWNWVTINNENEEGAVKIMKSNRWDVLPIKNKNNTFTKYFSTREWNNYEKLNLNKIRISQTIYYRLSLRDLIRKFYKEGKHYYFLSDYDQILGLVSLVNINCQMVYNYLYHVIADIERSIAGLLKQYVHQEDILKVFSNSSNKQLLNVKNAFEKDLQKNKDNSIFDYMYLSTISITLKKFIDKLPNNKRALGEFCQKFNANGKYNLIRNKIMHPVKSILDDKPTLADLDELLTDYTIIKEIIND